jgi:hypothetical protein
MPPLLAGFRIATAIRANIVMAGTTAHIDVVLAKKRTPVSRSSISGAATRQTTAKSGAD